MNRSTPKSESLTAEQRRFIDALLRVGSNSALERVAGEAGMSLNEAENVIDSLPAAWVRTYQLDDYPRMVALTFAGRKALGRANAG